MLAEPGGPNIISSPQQSDSLSIPGRQNILSLDKTRGLAINCVFVCLSELYTLGLTPRVWRREWDSNPLAMLGDSIVDLFAGYNARKQRDHNDKENRFLPFTSYPKNSLHQPPFYQIDVLMQPIYSTNKNKS